MVVRFGASKFKEAWDVDLVEKRRWQPGRGQGQAGPSRGEEALVLETGRDGLSRHGLRHSSDVG